MHHSQLINHLQSEGKLPEPKHDGSVTYHDPCYLGRIGGELEAPRKAIGGVDIETERIGKSSSVVVRWCSNVDGRTCR